MLTQGQIGFYRESGFLAVEELFTPAEMAQARAVVEELVEASRSITDHTDVYDLEPGHRPDAPRVRRLKTPCSVHPAFERWGAHLRQCSRMFPETVHRIRRALRADSSGYSGRRRDRRRR